MKKGLTVLIVVLVLTSVIGGAAAVDLEIGRELSVTGVGSFDCDLEVQSEKGYTGQKLEETLYTRWLGTADESQIEYNSVLEVFMSNITGDNRTAEIVYAQTSQTTNAKHFLFSGDYALGASVDVSSKGDSTKRFELYTDPDLSEFEIEGDISGRLKFMEKVVDPLNKTVYLKDITQLDGNYKYLLNFVVESSGYPAGGCGDWLNCP